MPDVRKVPVTAVTHCTILNHRVLAPELTVSSRFLHDHQTVDLY